MALCERETSNSIQQSFALRGQALGAPSQASRIPQPGLSTISLGTASLAVRIQQLPFKVKGVWVCLQKLAFLFCS